MISTLGLLWSTVGGSLAGYVFTRIVGRQQSSLTSSVNTIEILVAAHNEEKVIGYTLRSLQAAVERFVATHGKGVGLKITVGLDHCTDATLRVVEDFARTTRVPVATIENPGKAGKWNVLNLLARQSKADWVAFVDSGSLWEPELLVEAFASMSDGSVIGVAPSYSTSTGGRLEQLNWGLEQSLKRLENHSGGPVSVHGASVLYRREPLLLALAELNGTLWLNDDVVLPLTLRLQNPDKRIVYMIHASKPAFVGDCGVRSELAVEYRRRRRMVVGNLQWIQNKFLTSHRRNFGVTLIASRRVARMLWAYWALGLGASAVFALLEILNRAGFTSVERAVCAAVLGLGTMVLFAASNWIRRLAMAFLSGLQVPRLWRSLSKEEGGVSWV
ncbi:MAG: glycosyltransferase [Deltaproteobacteria bacterium]|nr:glycosyltransferase [Deltaproteobacteria bacterium]